MPDVKWYAGNVAIASGSGTANTLVKFGSVSGSLSDSQISDNGTNVTVSAGNFGISSTGIVTAQNYFKSPIIAWTDSGTGLPTIQTAVAANITALILGVSDTTGTSLAMAGTTIQAKLGDRSAYTGFEFATGYAATGAFKIGSTGTTTFPTASPYLILGGVSGAGGTPRTTDVTAGSGAVCYVQQAHDGVATKYVIAYNNYNGLTYISIPLDGTTTSWTHSQTRP